MTFAAPTANITAALSAKVDGQVICAVDTVEAGVSFDPRTMAYQLHRSVRGTSYSTSKTRRAPTMRVCAASSSVLRSIQQSVANKQQSAVEVTQAYLQQLQSVEGRVNAFLTVDEQAALSQVCSHSCCQCCQLQAGHRQACTAPNGHSEPTTILLSLQAAAVDAAIARGEPAGPLAGVPIAIKVSFLLNGTLKSSSDVKPQAAGNFQNPKSV